MLDKLFQNAGAKLKMLAKLSFALDLIAALIAAVALSKALDVSFIVGLILFVVLAVLGWLSVLAFYAFGELCENVRKLTQDR